MTFADVKPTNRKLVNGKGAASDADDGVATELSIVNDLEADAISTRPPDEFLSSKGVVFKLKKVPSMLVSEAGRRIKMPKPPVVYIEDKNREEENPDDPTFKEELRDAQIQQGILGVNTYLAFGTEVLTMPEGSGLMSWDDPQWSEDIEAITGVSIPIKGKARYAAWLKFYILDDEELTNLNIAIARFSGNVPEVDVTDAEDSFRNNPERSATEGLSDS